MLLSAIVGAVFLVLLLAITSEQDATARVRHGREALLANERLGLLLVDLETGTRGFVITGQERFLQPWNQARATFPAASGRFRRLAVGDGAAQEARAVRITRDMADYIDSYSIPLVRTARRDLQAARSVRLTAEGKRLVDNLRVELAGFQAAEHRILTEQEDAAAAVAMRALVAASIGLGASVVLVLLSGGYVARRVIRPVRDTSVMADRVAGGDFTVRMPGTGPGEVGVLQRAFNAMVGSLQDSRDQLRRVADEQSALRRVATLVASGAPPPEVFAAVAAETGGILGAATASVSRYEQGEAMTVVGVWAGSPEQGQAPDLGFRWLVEEGSIPAQIRQTGQAVARDYVREPGSLAEWARRHGLQAAVASPVFVEGRLWGVVVAAYSEAAGLRPAAAQARMVAFTELVAMAVSNSESREQLAASRARVVAAADESRRRIERDLHDGTQQRLISLALQMRAAAGGIPPAQAGLREQWNRVVQGLVEVTEDVREISRGLRPAILETGGLRPALRTLARSSPVPVDLHVDVRERLPDQAELTAFYVVSEALTNVAKHARASQVRVEAERVDDTLRVLVRDDGQGGADPARGSGLLGLSDRVEAAGGRIEVVSPPGSGTSLLVTIPVPRRSKDNGSAPGDSS